MKEAQKEEIKKSTEIINHLKVLADIDIAKYFNEEEILSEIENCPSCEFSHLYIQEHTITFQQNWYSIFNERSNKNIRVNNKSKVLSYLNGYWGYWCGIDPTSSLGKDGYADAKTVSLKDEASKN